MALLGKTNAEKIWNFCKSKGMNNYGAAAVLGNLDAESALNPKNMEDAYQSKLGMNDESYVASVDNGTYTNFENDCVGFGLMQLTWHTRKRAFLKYAREWGVSIGDLEVQMNFMYEEICTNYKSLRKTLETATSVAQASNAFMVQYECPLDQSDSMKRRRALMANTYYQRFVNGEVQSTSQRVFVYGSEGDDVKSFQEKLIKLGYSCGSMGADGEYGPSTVNAVRKFQREKGLYPIDGIAGKITQSKVDELINESDDSIVSTRRVRVTASSLNVRAGAGTNYRAVSYVRKGTICELLEEKNGWGKIKSPSGWISMTYVQEL